MASSKRKPSARAKARPAAPRSEPEDLEEPTSDEAAAADDDGAAGAKGAPAAEEASDRGADGKAATAAGAKDPVAKQAPKDPVPPTRDTGRKSAGTATGKGAQDEVSEKAKDATRSRSPKKSAAAEGARSGRRTAAPAQNPAWLVPTALTLLIVGLAYLVTYYLSAGTLPLPIDDWNLAAGFGIMLVGGGMLMFWK